MRIDRWINSNEESDLNICFARCDGLRRGAGRGYHSRTDPDTYPDSYHRATDRNSRAHADPGAYLDSDRDRHTYTDFNPCSNRSAGRLLACKQ